MDTESDLVAAGQDDLLDNEIKGLQKSMDRKGERYEEAMEKFPTANELQKVWRCIVCKEETLPYPFFLCENGHILCSDHEGWKLKHCPAIHKSTKQLCNGVVMRHTMKWYQYLCTFAQFQCPFSANGCEDVFVGIIEKQKHAMKCSLKFAYKKTSEMKNRAGDNMADSIQGQMETMGVVMQPVRKNLDLCMELRKPGSQRMVYQGLSEVQLIRSDEYTLRGMHYTEASSRSSSCGSRDEVEREMNRLVLGFEMERDYQK